MTLPAETGVDRARFLRAQACYYGLDGADNLGRYSDEDLASIYNGIGPEWFPEPLRKFIDRLHPDLRCVALVHDVDFHEGDGSREKFTVANRRLRVNGHRVAKAKYAWYNPMRYWIMWESSRFDNLCQAFGWGAYQEACRMGMNGGVSEIEKASHIRALRKT